MTGAWRAWHADDWPAELTGDAVMAADVRDRFHAKQGRTIARWAPQNGPVVYVKRHYRHGWLRSWLAHLGLARSDAWQEANHIAWAADHGFRVPRTVAVGQRCGPWGRLQGYIATEELTGMLPLHEAVPLARKRLSSPAFAAWKRGLTLALAAVVGRLHGAERFHKDLYLCHFYVPARMTHYVPGGWGDHIVMIDLHRLGHHPIAAAWWRLKDLAQLLYSTDVPGLTARDRLRFWRAYGGSRRSWLRRLILVRYRNYRRHNAARKARAA